MLKLPISVCSALTVIVVLAGCASPQHPEPDVERAAIESMFAARFQAFQKAPTPAEMADAYVRDVTEDAVWMPPNSPPVQGKEAVRAWAEDFFNNWVLQLDDTSSELPEIGGNVAVRRFTSTGVYIPRSGGESVPFDQKYVDVLRKDADGSWKLTLHMWSISNREPSIWR